MDSSAARNITDSKPLPPAGERAKKEDFKTMPDGRMLITDFDSSDDGAVAKGSSAAGRKRAMDELSDSDDSETGSIKTTNSGYQPGGSGIHRPIESGGKRRRLDKLDNKREFGSDFKAKKAGGDMKKKGAKFDPYAYVPLQRQTLNKRKQAKFSGQFKSLVRGAKSGAEAGRRARTRKANAAGRKRLN